MENGLYFKCIIKLIFADAPAKSFILNVKGQTGYSSCTKCWNEGEYLEQRILFQINREKKELTMNFFSRVMKVMI